MSGLLKSAYREPLATPREISARLVWTPQEVGDTSPDTSLGQREADELRARLQSDSAPELSVIRWGAAQQRSCEEYLTQTDTLSAPNLDLSGHVGEAISHQEESHQPSVILVTGGARGVTARCVAALARPGVTLILCGRTPHPDLADPADLAIAEDVESERALRAALARRDKLDSHQALSLDELKKRARVAWAQREVSEQLQTLEARGASALYLSLDLSAPEPDLERAASQLRSLLDSALASRGLTYQSIDSVIHGAGLIDDQRLLEKSEARFMRVFEVKVEGARRLWRALTEARRWLMFSSVAAALGNEGQVDYAAGNAALDCFVEHLSGIDRGAQRRVKGGVKGGVSEDVAWTTYRAHSIQWGPWAGAGMVDESLARLYASRGVRLIELSEGIERFCEVWRSLGDHDLPPVSLCTWPFSLPAD